MPSHNAVVAATADEVTTALNRFCSVVIDAHVGPSLEDLGGQVRNLGMNMERLSDKVSSLEALLQEKGQQLERKLADQQEKVHSIEKATGDRITQLQTMVNSVHDEQSRLDRARAEQDQLLESINMSAMDAGSRASSAEQNIRAGMEQLQKVEAGACASHDITAREKARWNGTGSCIKSRKFGASTGEGLPVKRARVHGWTRP